MKILVIDLFAGAGGVSTGFENTKGCKVIAAINHDEMAIASHAANHPETIHFVEDIKHIQMQKLQSIVSDAKSKYPDALLLLWASLECTNFSKAKGGLPRDADSRSLADYMPWYVESLNPDYVGIENVIEFMSWGPLDENGKPISRREGCDYVKWVNKMMSYGYKYDWRELNSANYGSYTSRKRFFAYFAKPELPIVWPQATHTKIKSHPENSFFSHLEKWKPVREVLDLQDKGKSIFDRKKPLSEKTLERIYAGLVKFVAGGKDAFSIKFNSMSQSGKYVAPDLNEPSPVVSTQGRLGICSTEFIAKYYGTGDNVGSVDSPSGTLTTKDRMTIVQPQFIYRDFSGGGEKQSIEVPAGSITGSPKMNLVSCDQFVMDTNFGNGPADLNEPCRTITANRKWHYLVNPQWFNTNGGSIEKPCATLIARMDKSPLSLVEVESEQRLVIEVYEDDSPMMVKIKEFMAIYGLADIKMRMLRIDELLRIQGFPNNYILLGTQTQQKKFIGNSVVPIVITKMAEALIQSIPKLQTI